jgi:rubredoxin
VSAHGRPGPEGPQRPQGTQRSNGRGPQRSGPPPVLWALLVVAAALVGGLAAAALVHVSLVVAVIVGVVAGGIAVALFRSSGHPAPWPAADADRPASWPVADRDGLPAARPRPAPSDGALATPTIPVSPVPAETVPAETAPAETVVQLLPAQPGRGRGRGQPRPGADQDWWNAAQGAPPAPSSDAERRPAPDLSSYLGSTLIAQCPRCGAFRLDFRRARSGWDFRCESCGHVWTWLPDSPWPVVRVAPKRRTQSRPAAP